MMLVGGVELNDFIYFSVAMIFFPLIHITWLTATSDLLFLQRKKLIISLAVLQAIIFEMVYFSLLIIDYSLLGTRTGLTIVQWADWIIIYILISDLIFFLTGMMFVRVALKSEDRKLRLKGKFLLLAFILFPIGIIFEVAFEPIEATILIARVLIIIAAFFFYFGFTLPKFLKKLFLKEDTPL